MRHLVLTLGLLSALGLFIIQTPLGNTTTFKYTQQASPLSIEAYGEKLAKEVDAVVKNIHAHVSGAEITHADILTIMCMESAGLVGKKERITSSAGARGLTQVMPATLKYYAKSHKGGFYLPNRPDLLYSDSRYSIEAGALIFNHHLMNYIPKYGKRDGRRAAAIAYNGGPGRVGKKKIPTETYKYAYKKLPHCYNNIINGVSPVRSNIWRVMLAEVIKLSDGKLTDSEISGELSDIPAINTSPEASGPAEQWWQSPQGRSSTRAEGARNSFTQIAPTHNRQPGQQARQADIKSSWSEEYLSNKKTNENQYLQNATLDCEKVGNFIKLQWSCPSGTTVSRGHSPIGANFNTRGASAGSLRSKLIGGNFKIACLRGHEVLSESSCNIISNNNIKNSSDSILMDIKYDSRDLVWSSLGADTCVLQIGTLVKRSLSGLMDIRKLHMPVNATMTCKTANNTIVEHKQIMLK